MATGCGHHALQRLRRLSDRSPQRRDLASDAEVEHRLAGVLNGGLVDIAITARTASGRAATVREVPGTTARSLLRLRSAWFSVVHEPRQ